MFGVSTAQLLILALIIALLFGTKRLKSLGSDLGGVIKGFRESVTEEEKEKPHQ